MKKFNLLIGGVLILILFFGIKFFMYKPKTVPGASANPASIQLKEEPANEGAALEDKQESESPQDNAEYEFPLKKGEPLLN
jgi:hypothetical protein